MTMLEENPVIKSIQSVITNFLLGDGKWRLIRLAFAVCSITLFTYLGHYAFRNTTLDQTIQTWIDRQSILKLVPGFILKILSLYMWDFRFLWVSTAALLAAILIGASYLNEIYQGVTVREAVRYLIGAMFGFLGASLTIDKGVLQVNKDAPNLIRDLGGPGTIVVQPGNVALFEHLDRPSKIQAEGVHNLSRFETVRRFQSDYELDGREIPTLDDRVGFVENVSATTKDGITIIVENLQYRYRLRMGREFGDFVSRDPESPNPFSVQAVKNMAYNRTVRIKNPETGETELTPWHNMVNIAVEGAITEYIREHQFDDVVVPKFPNDPRQVITNKIFSQGVRSRLWNYGAELLWWDIGHFKIADPTIADQLVDNWGTIWRGEAAYRLARGEAERIKNLELGRAEAQAEMLIETMTAFQNMQISQLGAGNVRNIMLARLAQLLDGMADQGFLPPGSGDDFLPPI
jgi:hypothetical protein